MKTRRILVPVLGSPDSGEIERDSFWLARYQPAELHIVEIKLPVSFLRWLFGPVIDQIKKLTGSQIRLVQRHAVSKENFCCKIGEVKAPDLVRGIIGAALEEEPDIIILLPEVSSRLGDNGMSNLKNRLSEIKYYLIIQPGPGHLVRVEPCKKKPLPDFQKVISINRGKWVV